MSGERLAAITGGGRGIGRGIAFELARLGWDLAINYRSDARSADETCREAERRGSTRAVAFAADIADLDDGLRLVSDILDRFGRIDLWVNNAGVAPAIRLDLLETTPESWDRAIGTNLRGPFFASQAAALALIDLAGRGVVADPQMVFITSISSTTASVSRGEYCVAKAGLSMVARLFATRLAEHNIRVHEIRPGIIATDMTGPVREAYDERIAGGLVPLRRWGLPEDVGRAVAALASGALPFSTGTIIDVDGGLHLPRL